MDVEAVIARMLATPEPEDVARYHDQLTHTVIYQIKPCARSGDLDSFG